MRDEPMCKDKVLLVERDPRVVEVLVESLIRRFNCDITCVASAEDALDVEVVEPHTVVISDMALPAMDAITLTRRLKELSERTVILMGEQPDATEALEALRAGASDYFVKPFEVSALLDSVRRAMDSFREIRQRRRRYERMRQLLRRVIRDRRGLNRRVELICRDLVGAHKRLVVRVLENEKTLKVGANS